MYFPFLINMAGLVQNTVYYNGRDLNWNEFANKAKSKYLDWIDYQGLGDVEQQMFVDELNAQMIEMSTGQRPQFNNTYAVYDNEDMEGVRPGFDPKENVKAFLNGIANAVTNEPAEKVESPVNTKLLPYSSSSIRDYIYRSIYGDLDLDWSTEAGHTNFINATKAWADEQDKKGTDNKGRGLFLKTKLNNLRYRINNGMYDLDDAAKEEALSNIDNALRAISDDGTITSKSELYKYLGVDLVDILLRDYNPKKTNKPTDNKTEDVLLEVSDSEESVTLEKLDKAEEILKEKLEEAKASGDTTAVEQITQDLETIANIRTLISANIEDFDDGNYSSFSDFYNHMNTADKLKFWSLVPDGLSIPTSLVKGWGTILGTGLGVIGSSMNLAGDIMNGNKNTIENAGMNYGMDIVGAINPSSQVLKIAKTLFGIGGMSYIIYNYFGEEKYKSFVKIAQANDESEFTREDVDNVIESFKLLLSAGAIATSKSGSARPKTNIPNTRYSRIKMGNKDIVVDRETANKLLGITDLNEVNKILSKFQSSNSHAIAELRQKYKGDPVRSGWFEYDDVTPGTTIQHFDGLLDKIINRANIFTGNKTVSGTTKTFGILPGEYVPSRKSQIDDLIVGLNMEDVLSRSKSIFDGKSDEEKAAIKSALTKKGFSDTDKLVINESIDRKFVLDKNGKLIAEVTVTKKPSGYEIEISDKKIRKKYDTNTEALNKSTEVTDGDEKLRIISELEKSGQLASSKSTPKRILKSNDGKELYFEENGVFKKVTLNEDGTIPKTEKTIKNEKKLAELDAQYEKIDPRKWTWNSDKMNVGARLKTSGYDLNNIYIEKGDKKGKAFYYKDSKGNYIEIEISKKGRHYVPYNEKEPKQKERLARAKRISKSVKELEKLKAEAAEKKAKTEAEAKKKEFVESLEKIDLGDSKEEFIKAGYTGDIYAPKGKSEMYIKKGSEYVKITDDSGNLIPTNIAKAKQSIQGNLERINKFREERKRKSAETKAAKEAEKAAKKAEAEKTAREKEKVETKKRAEINRISHKIDHDIRKLIEPEFVDKVASKQKKKINKLLDEGKSAAEIIEILREDLKSVDAKFKKKPKEKKGKKLMNGGSIQYLYSGNVFQMPWEKLLMDNFVPADEEEAAALEEAQREGDDSNENSGGGNNSGTNSGGNNGSGNQTVPHQTTKVEVYPSESSSTNSDKKPDPWISVTVPGKGTSTDLKEINGTDFDFTNTGLELAKFLTAHRFNTAILNRMRKLKPMYWNPYLLEYRLWSPKQNLDIAQDLKTEYNTIGKLSQANTSDSNTGFAYRFASKIAGDEASKPYYKQYNDEITTSVNKAIDIANENAKEYHDVGEKNRQARIAHGNLKQKGYMQYDNDFGTKMEQLGTAMQKGYNDTKNSLYETGLQHALYSDRAIVDAYNKYTKLQNTYDITEWNDKDPESVAAKRALEAEIINAKNKLDRLRNEKTIEYSAINLPPLTTPFSGVRRTHVYVPRATRRAQAAAPVIFSKNGGKMAEAEREKTKRAREKRYFETQKLLLQESTKRLKMSANGMAYFQKLMMGAKP